jgi:hypothetical protein
LKSRATWYSPVLPPSFTDVPAPSGQGRCRIHPEHCCKLHTEAIRGLRPRSDRNDCDGDARTCRRRRRSRRKPDAACGTRASRMHVTKNMQLAGSPAVASRPAEAARAPGRAFTICNMPDVARASCAHSRPIPIRDQCQHEVGWARLARAMRLTPTTSGDFSRSNARGRRDLHSPPNRMDVPKAWQPRNAAISARDERSVVAVPSERRRSPRSDRSLGGSPADRRDWLAACNTMHQHSRSARRGARSAGRVIGRPRHSAR